MALSTVSTSWSAASAVSSVAACAVSLEPRPLRARVLKGTLFARMARVARGWVDVSYEGVLRSLQVAGVPLYASTDITCVSLGRRILTYVVHWC
jgi:hypothetical protein